MENSIYVNWGGHHVKLSWHPRKVISDTKLITSVHGYCFFNGKILLVNVKGRGFNNPGGHIENGETPEEAFHREALEEAYVKGTIIYLGAIEVSHEENPLYDPKGKYPLVGYQFYYKMNIEECLPFQQENETTSRILVEPDEVQNIMNDHSLALIILRDALAEGDF